jgi:hypothetical protein
MEKLLADLIPAQEKGRAMTAKSSRQLSTVEEAKEHYHVVRRRLLNVTGWHGYAGVGSATFHLLDAKGKEVQRKVEKNDYFKIDLPGPGSKSGYGFDWVHVEAYQAESTNENEATGFRVRPVANPFTSEKETAHFFSDESTSSFLVYRHNTIVSVEIYDRNTKPNTDASNIADKLRNITVGIAGFLGFAKIHWQKLADEIIKP